jgi:hypothetical protein
MKKKLLILMLVCFSGFTTAVSAQTQTQKSEQTETKLVILSHPYPIFNSKARKKGVQGTVRLRVTFTSDGEIGDVIDIPEKNKEKFVKYGLTEQAIIAAKNIKFKPATKDGEPITVTKIVEYAFAIY